MSQLDRRDSLRSKTSLSCYLLAWIPGSDNNQVGADLCGMCLDTSNNVLVFDKVFLSEKCSGTTLVPDPRAIFYGPSFSQPWNRGDTTTTTLSPLLAPGGGFKIASDNSIIIDTDASNKLTFAWRWQSDPGLVGNINGNEDISVGSNIVGVINDSNSKVPTKGGALCTDDFGSSEYNRHGWWWAIDISLVWTWNGSPRYSITKLCSKDLPADFVAPPGVDCILYCDANGSSGCNAAQQSCVCKPGFDPTTGCKSCLYSYIFDASTNTCYLPLCSSNAECSSVDKGATCGANGKCRCSTGFIGPHCENVCVDGGTYCVHGKCTAGGCQCDPGYKGDNCNTPQTCEDLCQHGKCANGTCLCEEGYTGTYCDTTKGGGAAPTTSIPWKQIVQVVFIVVIVLLLWVIGRALFARPRPSSGDLTTTLLNDLDAPLAT